MRLTSALRLIIPAAIAFQDDAPYLTSHWDEHEAVSDLSYVHVHILLKPVSFTAQYWLYLVCAPHTHWQSALELLLHGSFG